MLTRREFLTAGTAAAVLTALCAGPDARSGSSGALAQTLTRQPRMREAVPPTSPNPVSARPSDHLGGYTINVGGKPPDLQAAIDASRQGDTLVCPAGAVYGPITLPVRMGAGWTCIRTSASLPAGTRVTPADVAKMFTVQGNGVTDASPALVSLNDGVHTTQGWRFIGMNATQPADTHQYVTVSAGADRMSFERCYVHGRPKQNMRRCFFVRGNDFQIWDSWVSDAHEVGSDSQAIFCRNNARFHAENCEFQGAAENILLGDQDSPGPSLDTTIKRCHFFKPMSWLSLLNNDRPNPQYAGERWSVKNLFEIKWAFRVLLEGNILENNCGGNQDGTAFLVNAGQPGGVTDVLAVSNTISNAPHMFTINTVDRTNSIPARLAFRNNIGLQISRRFCLLLHRNTDIAFEHNTVVPQTPAGLNNAQSFYIAPDGAGDFPRQTFKRNVVGTPRYGILTEGGSLDTLLPDREWLENAQYGQTGSPPPGVTFFPSAAAAGVDTVTGALARNSPLKAAGSDGEDLGVDFAALDAAQQGSTSA
jgi:hypothetical protein